MGDKVYKYTDDNNTFIYVLAPTIEVAKQKILENVISENITFKYCESDENKVLSIKKALERGEQWLSNTKSIVIY